MTLREIMQDEAGKVIIRHHLAEWLTVPASYQYLDLTVEQILPHGYGMLSTENYRRPGRRSQPGLMPVILVFWK